MANSNYAKIAKQYAEDIVAGRIPAEEHKVAGCKRYLADLKRTDLKLNTKDADFVINAIQRFIVHNTGEDISGRPLMGTPLMLLPWQVFIVYNLVGFENEDGNKRFKEAFIYTPRKNGKTLFVAGLAWGLSLLYATSGSQLYIVAGSSKQAEQSFGDIVYSVKDKGLKNFKIHNTYVEHSIEWKSEDKGKVVASMRIDALASNPDKHDSFICNLAIVDELHAVPAKEYNRFKEAQKSFSNRLIIAITTAGDNVNSFGFRRLEYAKKVVNGLKDDSFFAYISMAEQDENGNVDYTNPLQHEKANPSYGVTIRPQDMLEDAMQAQNDPQQRKDFLSRSLNVYTSATRAYFDIEKFKASNLKAGEALKSPDMATLSQLPIVWYGGADLSKLHDLTAGALYGSYAGIDICITHAFFPIVMAHAKAEEDNIPLFGWADDGLLTLCNTPTVNYTDIVNWFVGMREMGFNITKVAFDKKFGREFFSLMSGAGFRMEDAPQYYWAKSEGFRHIEKKVNDGQFYYLGNEAYEYCVSNVHAIEKTDDMIQYEKIEKKQRIDLFDASVFACRALLADEEKQKKAEEWEWA